ncbi:MAG: penicillin-binding protein 1A [Thermodesulfobacteriota bacterium]
MRKKTIATLSLFIAAGLIFGAMTGGFFALMRDLPQIRALENHSPSSVSRIYSADKQLLAELYVQKRDPVTLDQVPEDLTEALIATEDRQFYEHSGLDLKGIMRAVFHDIMAGEFVEGASTLTQQLAKTLFLTPEKSLARKLKEAFLAFQLERRYTKDEILELYLNQVYFGSGAYGVKMAAEKYFAKPVSRLNLSECAMIAGLPKAPSVYSPLVNPELAIKRRNIVLTQMRATDRIDQKTYEQSTQTAYSPPEKTKSSKRAPYFVDFIKKRLEKTIGSDALYKGGLTIMTTLSYKMQQRAEAAVKDGLAQLRTRMEQNRIEDPGAQSALVSIDVNTGGIVAMVGGRDYAESPYNRATTARRQPGSAFKPIVYGYAIEHGFDQASLLLDAPVAYPGEKPGMDWRPENFSHSYQGEITLRKALTRSENIPSVRLLQKLGPSAVVDFAGKCGIDSKMKPYLSLALGTFETTLMELTAAYTVFANKGAFIEPYGVTEVIDPDGRVIRQAAPEKRLVMSRPGAAVMTDILKGVIKHGTGKNAANIGRPIAGKTGTTNKYRDALFVGFSPTIATGVWTGRDDFGSLGRYETGARAALPTWKAFMADALSDRPVAFFDRPDEIVEIRMDPDTGKRLRQSGGGVTARFRRGHAPE